MQKDANLVELEKCCQTRIFLQTFVLIQPRTSPPKKCKNLQKTCKIKKGFKNLQKIDLPILLKVAPRPGRRARLRPRLPRGLHPQVAGGPRAAPVLADQSARRTRRVVANFWQNFGKMLLVFGCIGTDFCKKIRVLQHFSKSTRLSS